MLKNTSSPLGRRESRTRGLYVGAAYALTRLAGCVSPNGDSGLDPTRLALVPDASAGRAPDATVLEWNEIAVDAIGAQAPFPSTRFMATVQLAVFEAVNAITHEYASHLDLSASTGGARPDAAAVAAAAAVLMSYLPDAAATVERRRGDSLGRVPDGQAKTDGVAIGEAAADAVMAHRANDGASSTPQLSVPRSTTPYEWQATPSCTGLGGAFFHWQNVAPFGIESASQFRASAPPALTAAEYSAAYAEVQAVGAVDSAQRPLDRENVARIYAAQPPHQGWNSIARQRARARHESLTHTARTLALLNMSLSDAHISVFESKYFYAVWRPETAIPRGDEDGNDSTLATPFAPLVVTPCFPGYPSAHGAGAGAASEVLRAAYGESGHSLTNSHPGVPGVVLAYTALQEVVDDVSDARVFGGIHFRFDQDAGERQGTNVAKYNLQRLLRSSSAVDH